ncbi:MAG: UDP-2,3-diacylglucosamine diphosphatase LpxI [Rhodospirillales bacterium]|nr:UDP-2,3-diacylglucosamine diphosphatase LpxI [Rhodospirillales bacterium]
MPRKLGILAGGGLLPRLIVRHCVDSGREFFVIAFENQADGRLTEPIGAKTIPHARIRLGAAGGSIKALRKAGVRELVMAGTIVKPTMAELRPDLWTMRFLARTGGFDKGDDAILSALIGALEGEGFAVTGIEDLLPDLIAPEGVLGRHSPSEGDNEDMAKARDAALEIGARDIGQGAVARGGAVVAREGRAGTDAMLAACAETAPAEPKGVLVKMAKPGQERRVDLPAIGPKTVDGARKAGLRGIAVEAGGALILDRDAVVRAADEAGLFLVGIRGEGGS